MARTPLLKKLCLAATLLVGLAHPATSATLTSILSTEGTVIVTLNGKIAPGDADRLQQIIRKEAASGIIVAEIWLNSSGGGLLESSYLIDTIRSAKIASFVPKRSKCVSECFLVFAASAEKYANYGALIVVNSGSKENGLDGVGSSELPLLMAIFFKELGVPDDIIGRMVVTHPNQVDWLTPDDLRTMGVTMTNYPFDPFD